MARKRKGRPVHGWVVLDKPAGISSAKAVRLVQNVFDAAKAGHGGTLDPLATGVLPIALGEATKTVSYAMDGLKTYQFDICWGEQRNTDDAEGEVIETSPIRPTENDIINVLPDFTGDIEQTPPIYSAIKVDGRRAYKLARENIDVELKPRPVFIEKLELISILGVDRARFQTTTGKGVYIRSLGRDMAIKLGTFGYIENLRRTQVGCFHVNDAISLDKLETLGHSSADFGTLRSVKTVLDDIPALALTAQEAFKIRQGQGVAFLPVANRSAIKTARKDQVFCVMCDDQLVALANINGGEIKPFRVMNY